MKGMLSIAGLGCCAVLQLASVQAAGAAPVRYDGYRLAELDVKTPAELDSLIDSGVILLDCTPGPGTVRAIVPPLSLAPPGMTGIPVRIMHANVQQLIDSEKEQLSISADGRTPFDGFFDGYHPYGNTTNPAGGSIVWYMNQLAARYPQLATLIDVGTSVEGRTIRGLRITSAIVSDKPAAVFFGGEHAREWITPTVPLFLARHLLEKYGDDPVVTNIVDRVEFLLIPVMNVDGYVYSWTTDRLWRKNREPHIYGMVGVDLNRNWGDHWGGSGSSALPSSQFFRGEQAFSEPETRAMRDFFLARDNIRVQIDIHSFGQLILWPHGYTLMLPPDQATYLQIGAAMQTLVLREHGLDFMTGTVAQALYTANGASIDWTYNQLGVLSYLFECRDVGQYGFELPPDRIIPANEEILPAMLYLANSEWTRDGYPQPPEVRVDGSRHLAVSPPPGFDAVTLRVLVPDGSCPPLYIQADGALADRPQTLSSAEWGTVRVFDPAIVPGATYQIVADYDGVSSAAIASARLPEWGSVVPPHDVVDFADIKAVVSRFQMNPDAPPTTWCDLWPQTPDGIVDFNDILAAVRAFQQQPYPYAAVEPCS